MNERQHGYAALTGEVNHLNTHLKVLQQVLLIASHQIVSILRRTVKP